jgi:hypothetical protein
MFGFGRLRSARSALQTAARLGLILAALLVALRLAAPHAHAKAHFGGSDSTCSVCATVSAPVDSVAPAPALEAPARVAFYAPAGSARAPRDSHRSLHDSRGPPVETQQ